MWLEENLKRGIATMGISEEYLTKVSRILHLVLLIKAVFEEPARRLR